MSVKFEPAYAEEKRISEPSTFEQNCKTRENFPTSAKKERSKSSTRPILCLCTRGSWPYYEEQASLRTGLLASLTERSRSDATSEPAFGPRPTPPFSRAIPQVPLAAMPQPLGRVAAWCVATRRGAGTAGTAGDRGLGDAERRLLVDPDPAVGQSIPPGELGELSKQRT